MYYAIYKNVRDSAWLCLLDNHIDRLPVDVLKIARSANIHVKKNSTINDLLPDEDAKSYYDGQQWIIIYNDLNDITTSRFAIAHELGHIFLGHATTHTKYANVREFGSKPKSEQQADMFALRLLCPACVLMGIDLHSAEEIAHVCRVPLRWAKMREGRMETLYKRQQFLTSNIESAVYKQFESFRTNAEERIRYGIHQ